MLICSGRSPQHSEAPIKQPSPPPQHNTPPEPLTHEQRQQQRQRLKLEAAQKHAEQIAQTAHLLSVPKQDEFVLNVVSIGNADSRSYARQPLETHFREFSETSRESLLVDAMTTIARHGLSDRAKERSAQFLYKASSQLTERESARLSIWKLHNPVVRSHLRNAERGDYEVYSMTYAAVDEHRAGRSDKLVLTGELDTSGAPQPGWGKHVPNPDTLDVAFAIVRDEVKAKNILDNRGDRNREGDASVRS